MNVFLMGFMGSGKTSIGRPLASQLGMNFIDLDSVLETNEQLKVSEIFNDKGEDYFRNLEHSWLSTFNGINSLISVGGGTPCFNNNLKQMEEKGVTIYLKLPVQMLANRLINAKAIRPIIEPYRHDKEALINFISVLLVEREKYYKKADLVFETSNLTANKKSLLVEMIKKCLQKKTDLLQ
ncbi:MAG: shikimate kinase [Crocinitomicaceae bacterium]